MMRKNFFSLLDPIISAQARSNVRQNFSRILRAHDPANRTYENFAAPILLIGSPRGGTTLLSNIIGAHPRITIFNERFTRGKPSYADTFGATNTQRALANSFLRYIPHRVKGNNLRWGIKLCTIHWTREDLDRFVETFPQLQLVFVVRDGRDVVLSLLKRSIDLRTPEQCVGRWLESVSVFDYLQSRAPERFMSFHYEDLVGEPEGQVRAICEFIGEPFTLTLLDPKQWPRVGSYEISPVTADKVGKWRDGNFPQLPPDLQREFDTALEHLGYQVETFQPHIAR